MPSSLQSKEPAGPFISTIKWHNYDFILNNIQPFQIKDTFLDKRSNGILVFLFCVRNRNFDKENINGQNTIFFSSLINIENTSKHSWLRLSSTFDGVFFV